MWPAINLGPFVLPTAALTYLLGAWLLLSVTERVARQLDQDAEVYTNLVTAGLIVGFVGARLTFVLLFWPAYQNNLLSIVWPLNAGFSPAGGVIFGAAALFFYGRYKQLPLAASLDILAPIMVSALMVVSVADFVGGPGYGTTANVPWAIDQFGVPRHPVQIYELLVGAAALLAWWALRRRRAYAGQLFLVTASVYCFGRLFVDAFRADTPLVAGGWHLVQILCLAVVLTSLVLLARHASTGDLAAPAQDAGDAGKAELS